MPGITAEAADCAVAWLAFAHVADTVHAGASAPPNVVCGTVAALRPKPSWYALEYQRLLFSAGLAPDGHGPRRVPPDAA